MIYTIASGALTAKINSRGAEPVSLKDRTGCEYLWQGAKGGWKNSCYHIFPIAGRSKDNTYSVYGKEYEMPLHGFALSSEFTLRSLSENSITLEMEDGDVTRSRYPFRFAFSVTMHLNGFRLETVYRAENRDEKTMYCNFGAHPGFLLPLDEPFEAHTVTFDGDTEELFLGAGRLLTGERAAAGRTVRLARSMFTHGARIFQTQASSLRLCTGERSVTMTFAGFPFVVLWSDNEELLCVEPWDGASMREGAPNDLESRKYILSLQPGERAEKGWAMEINNEKA